MKEIITRINIEDDTPFIIDSWLRSYYEHSDFATNIPRKVFNEKHGSLIKQLFNKSQIRIAASKEDPEVIVGYIVFEKGKIHYVYVKEPFRRLGICKTLLFEHGFFENTLVTHLTYKGKKILLKMGYLYAPYF